MKKIIIVVIVLLVIGGVGYYKMSGTTGNSGGLLDRVAEKKEQAKRSLSDLIGSGVAQKCNWRWDDGGSSASGSMWISGKRFKQEINTVDATTKKETKMIVATDEKNVYMWSSEMGKKGIKMPVGEDQANSGVENEKIDWNTQYNYECAPAVVTDKDLSPPDDIEFEDLGIQLQQLKELQDKYGTPTGE
ncbi:MAG: hypothetical protein WAV41_01765 [Microgenomates group bacterium]